MLPTPPGLARPVASLTELLLRRADASPDLPMYTFVAGDGRERRLTVSGLAAAADRVAARLSAHARPGERALLLFAPGLDYIVALFGCLRAGVVPVPTYPPLPGRSAAPTRAIATAAGAELALTSTGLMALVVAAPELRDLRLRWLAVGAEPGPAVSPVPDLVRPSPAETAILQFTSGSTANPRGVRLSHANLLVNLAIICDRFRHDAGSVGVIWLPPYHDMGLVGGLLEPLYAGFPVVLMSPLDFLRRPARWLEAVSHYRATISGGPDFAYALAIRRTCDEVRAGLDLSSWRVAFTGAERIRASTLAAFRATFGPVGFDAGAFHPCYGLAEATLYSTGVQGVTIHPDAVELVSCGRVAAGHEVRVVDLETGLERGPDEVGEVWLRGASVAAGYHAGAAPERFAGRLPAPDDGGPPWLRTGDLGRLRDDHLYIVGRLAARVVVRGRTLQAEDIEDVAGAATDLLRPGRAVAFTVEDDPETRLILLHEVRTAAADIDPAAIADAVQGALARALGVALDGLVLVAPGAVPLTSSGKVRRAAASEAWTSGALSPLATWWADRP